MNKYIWMTILWLTFPVSFSLLFIAWLIGLWLFRNEKYGKVTFNQFIIAFKYHFLGELHD